MNSLLFLCGHNGDGCHEVVPGSGDGCLAEISGACISTSTHSMPTSAAMDENGSEASSGLHGKKP